MKRERLYLVVINPEVLWEADPEAVKKECFAAYLTIADRLNAGLRVTRRPELETASSQLAVTISG